MRLLQRRHRERCRFPPCSRELVPGDVVVKVGSSVYHASCAPRIYADWDEPDDDCEGDGEQNDDFFEDEYNDEEAK